MDTRARKIAILQRPSDQPPNFLICDEEGRDDRRPTYLHGQKYANGGFTGERCMEHPDGLKFFRLDDHDDRFIASVEAHEHLVLACSRELRDRARCAIMAANYPDDYFSVNFASVGDVGVYPHTHEPMLYINSRDMDPERSPYLPAHVLREGLRVRICEPDVRRNPPGRIAQAKASANYLGSNIAKHRALQAGCDDGILLDWTSDYVSELSVSNLVLLEDNRLVTPHAASGPLNGITKQTIATLAQDFLNLPMVEEAVSVERLGRMRAAFATGTAIGIVPINAIIHHDGHTVWEGTRPDASGIVQKLATTYWQVLRGRHRGYRPEWFTPIPADILERYDSPWLAARTR